MATRDKFPATFIVGVSVTVAATTDVVFDFSIACLPASKLTAALVDDSFFTEILAGDGVVAMFDEEMLTARVAFPINVLLGKWARADLGSIFFNVISRVLLNAGTGRSFPDCCLVKTTLDTALTRRCNINWCVRYYPLGYSNKI